uniref:Uncharacterized protein n=1 Tax=Tetranychus urticae TaxID=32264 RepID=T1K679_TETUR
MISRLFVLSVSDNRYLYYRYDLPIKLSLTAKSSIIFDS